VKDIEKLALRGVNDSEKVSSEGVKGSENRHAESNEQITKITPKELVAIPSDRGFR
jgi:hypothetical protein